MVAKIDIDALKIFTKLRTNEAEIRQKIKTTSLNSKVTGSKKRTVYINYNINVYRPTTSRALHVIKKIVVW